MEIIKTMKSGGVGFEPNIKIATALVLEANLGLRIEDILKLKLSDIIEDGKRYRLNIVEKKTGKRRSFTVPDKVYKYMLSYAQKVGRKEEDILFDVGERQVQRILKITTDYLGYKNVGTHSFRKYFATEIYENNGHDIVLVQKLLQHSSFLTTQRYVGISTEAMETALRRHVQLL
jgi:integrase